jgi:hypothetical protein
LNKNGGRVGNNQGLTLSRGRVHMTHVANDAGRPRLPNHHSYTFPNGDSYVGEWRDGMIEVLSTTTTCLAISLWGSGGSGFGPRPGFLVGGLRPNVAITVGSTTQTSPSLPVHRP